MTRIAFDDAARVPADGDNVAIAVRRLEAGTTIEDGDDHYRLPNTVLEGHRFARTPIANGEPLLSWGLPFGIATRAIVPGEYVCNESILEVLSARSVDVSLPESPNFVDHMKRYELDEAHFEPGQQITNAGAPHSFVGFPRDGARGVGTRNFIIVIATTARSNAIANALARRFDDASERFANVDGVVSVEHTEGSGSRRPNNLEFVMRTLAGFVVHPNVAAAVIVDHGAGAYSNHDLQRFAEEQGYPLDAVPHRWLTVEGTLDSELARGEALIEEWLPIANAARRVETPLSELKIALQCGGSDAFSGVSGNALAGWVAKAVVAEGGSANLAETDELIGAEPYVLSNVRDVDTARRFLDKIETFKERAGWHGANAEGNPSGGNKLRGLYNIALKSIGAARKLDPEVRLDHVIDYAAPMCDRGYHFMDSPGNDLESIAGQVASGCNMIFFITGNGSITNFPFVPTLKFVTTSGRFEMLENEMDVNAGRYNDGMSMQALGEETLDLTLRVAGGERSKGELAGHAQVQIWRDWKQTNALEVELIRDAPKPDSVPLAVADSTPSPLHFEALKTNGAHACDQVALVMPTSLCSGQVARVIAEQLDARHAGEHGVSRYVALVHTEGCGSANTDDLYLRTLCGHLRHGFTRRAVLLEHGCERTHNDAVRLFMREHDLPAERFGWASVQLDGGMAAVTDKVTRWFESSLADEGAPAVETVNASKLRIALLASGALPEQAAALFSRIAGSLVAAGATVIVPESGPLADSTFARAVLANGVEWRATLAYGESAQRAGLHVMQSPTEAPIEIVTGLGGTGAEIMLAHVGDAPLQSHPMVPLLQVSAVESVQRRFADDLDLLLGNDATADERQLTDRIADVASRRYRPRLSQRDMSGFQLTRGLLGISM